jgi:hypothetical protein
VKKYKNKSANSGIISYAIGSDYIAIRFTNRPDTYIYDYSKAGKHHVDRMKELAEKGEGLSTYINRHAEVKNNFSLQSAKKI